MFKKIAAVPAYRIVCDTIEARILDGSLPPGALLPIETELSAQFGLARHTVREGLRILEEGGFVQREAGRRLYVRLPDHAELAPRASRALMMQRVTFRELLEVTLALEPAAATGAALRAKPSDIKDLEDIHQAMAAASAKGETITPFDIAFHSRIAEIGGNKALLLAREPISALFYPALERLMQAPADPLVTRARMLQAHRAIIDALACGEADRAGLWMTRHMRDFRRGYELYGFDLDEALGAAAG
ncbi:FadR/GntR family transcriptional regulator [Falsigemmobacter faecalis]|uniref:FadR family transcriptional regulator n=1 Tax=Falsigemmobacter faecalis TaxID=2488730 RepID=A0A3P3DFD2_9RHOB|nr:FCD domain-containing protein [Falsigemmobacter faecalis]RRH73001.1 FadR family transcriptional regulator [Falsigemmobacter faecalis]